MVEPAHVFEAGDLVRFRFRTNFSGYLYVLNHATSGKYASLFPNEESGTDNQIRKHRTYVVPMTENGWYRLDGPPGYETVYWIFTPVMTGPPYPKPPSPTEPLNPAIKPRCNDEIFRTRGECLDVSAGPRAIKDPAELPRAISDFSGVTARDLTVSNSDKKTALISAAGEGAPFTYVFRVAHR